MARRPGTHDWASPAILHERKPVQEDRDKLQAKAAGKGYNFCLSVFDEITAGLCMLAVDKPLSNRPDSSSDTLAGFAHIHTGARLLQVHGGREPSQAGPCDENSASLQIVLARHCPVHRSD